MAAPHKAARAVLGEDCTRLHEIGISLSLKVLHMYPIAPCPGGGSMGLYLNSTLEKWDLCIQKPSVKARDHK